jgi:hypothetical protein
LLFWESCAIVVDSSSFEEETALLRNKIVAPTEETTEVLAADENYAPDGSVCIYDM